MRNKKFWDNNPDSELWKQTLRFVEENDKTCGLSDEEQNEYAKEIIEFIELNKKSIGCEYNLEWWREDVYRCLRHSLCVFGEQLYEVIPISVVDKIAKDWRNDIDGYMNSEGYSRSFLEERLRECSWFTDCEKYGEEEQQLYLVYLNDWYKLHEEGSPACISEFLNNEMKDEELSAYYKQLLETKKAGKAQEKTQAELIQLIINRAALLGFLHMERCVAEEIMKLATEYYDLNLEAMVRGSDFDFLHDFVYIPMHFHSRKGFDNKFLPRFSKRSLQ